jgi:hypothetical protein
MSINNIARRFWRIADCKLQIGSPIKAHIRTHLNPHKELQGVGGQISTFDIPVEGIRGFFTQISGMRLSEQGSLGKIVD